MKSTRPAISKLIRSELDHILGLTRYYLKQWNKSEIHFTKACVANPNQAKSSYMIGRIALRKKRYAKASKFIRLALYIKPNHRNWLLELWQIEKLVPDSQLPKSKVVESEILSLIDKHKNNVFFNCELAKEFRRKGKTGQEIGALKQVIQLEKNNPELIYQLGTALARLERYAEAASYYEQAVNINDSNPEWYYSLGYALSCTSTDGQPDFVKSEHFYSKAICLQKTESLKRLGIGFFHQAFERWELAKESYTKLLNQSPSDSERLFRIGTCYDRQYDWKNAETSYKKAIDLDPKQPSWFYRLGFVRERQNLFELAASAYESAADLEKSPSSNRYLYRQGYVLEKKQDYRSACEAFDKIAPTTKTTQKRTGHHQFIKFPHDKFAESWIEEGKTLQEQSKWSGAVIAYQQAISRRNLHDPNLYLFLGHCLVNLGRFQEACISYRQSQIFEGADDLFGTPPSDDPGFWRITAYTEYSENLKIQEKTVFYESSFGGSMSGHPHRVFEVLRTLEPYSDWKHVWSVQQINSIPVELRNHPNIIFVSPNSDLYLRYLATSKLLITNDSLPSYFIRRKEQTYLNTLHQEALSKHCEFNGVHEGNLGRTFLQATHILNSTEYESDHLIRKAVVKGLAHGKFIANQKTILEIIEDIIGGPTETSKPTKEKYRILIYGGNFGPTGITTSLINLLQALDYSRVDVFLAVNFQAISQNTGSSIHLKRIPSQVQIISRTDRINLTIEEKFSLDAVAKNPRIINHEEIKLIYMKAYAREFQRIFGTSIFDAAINFEGYSVLWASILGCIPNQNSGLRIIYQHNDLLGELRSKYRYLEQTFNLYQFFDKIVSVSKLTMELNRSSLSETYGLSLTSFDYVENIVDPSAIIDSADIPDLLDKDLGLFDFNGSVFLAIGRLSVEKDHQKLIHAFAELHKVSKSIRLLIIGDGPLMLELKKQIIELKQEGHIFLLGFKDNPFPYLKQADCFVLSSNHEGQPMVLLEAITLEKPIVTTNIPGSRSVIEGRSGLLVENSVTGLFRGMLAFIKGEIIPNKIDMKQYRSKAIEAFYQNACGIRIEKNT